MGEVALEVHWFGPGWQVVLPAGDGDPYETLGVELHGPDNECLTLDLESLKELYDCLGRALDRAGANAHPVRLRGRQ